MIRQIILSKVCIVGCMQKPREGCWAIIDLGSSYTDLGNGWGCTGNWFNLARSMVGNQLGQIAFNYGPLPNARKWDPNWARIENFEPYRC